MSVQPREIEFTADDFTEVVSYDDFEPGNYVGTLTSVDMIEAKTGNYGWKWTFTVQGLPFNTVTWLKGGGGWKLKEMMEALGANVQPGKVTVDPNAFLGRKATVRIGYDAKSNRPELLTILKVLPVAQRPGAGEQQSLDLTEL